jgi:hypothetical protein
MDHHDVTALLLGALAVLPKLLAVVLRRDGEQKEHVEPRAAAASSAPSTSRKARRATASTARSARRARRA